MQIFLKHIVYLLITAMCVTVTHVAVRKCSIKYILN